MPKTLTWKDRDPLTSLDRRLPPGFLAESLRADARRGLALDPKSLPPKWFYDAQGSALFDKITELREYYPTRAEREILHATAAEIAGQTRARTLVELGSGSSDKTRLLLDALRAAVVPLPGVRPDDAAVRPETLALLALAYWPAKQRQARGERATSC